MNFFLVFQLITILLSVGQSHTEPTRQNPLSCSKSCSAGYYNSGPCGENKTEYICKECLSGTFTELKNNITRCLRCDNCGNFDFETQPCTSATNRKCDKCNCNHCKRNNSGCCKRLTCIPSTTTTTTTTATTTPSTSTATLKDVLGLAAVLALLLGLFWFILFIRNRCLCWRAKKDLEPPVILKEQGSHQGSSPHTLTLHISEDTPMVTLSQSAATTEHRDHIRPPLPDDEHKVIKPIDQYEHWPAIVLYAIIKEVPLRRWKEFLRLLSLADQQLERVELEAGSGLGSIERQYQMLRLWSQRSSASLNDVFSALHYMDLCGCAQLLQENLDKLQWKP
ncbi:tumor necrosis factor receptor superfamily member 1A isoform X2 [Eleginops maclovinus]|uniref:tumor necrosis factor receptor superfamily member 1A isoform X2 n=1 Tax=Eleginops maclovinus TaxID=56733 RepID=UPI00308026E3